MNTLKSYIDWKLTHSDKIAEANGYPLVLEKCKRNKKMKDLKVYGNSVQDGTPTPENPIEVSSIGEKTKNIYHSSRVYTKNAGWYLDRNGMTWTDGSLETFANTTAVNGLVYAYIGLASEFAGKTLCMSFKPKTKYVRTGLTGLVVLNAITNFPTVVDSSTKLWHDDIYYNSITIPENPEDTYHICIRLYGTNFSVGDIVSIEDIMIYEGTEPLPYEPYDKYKIPIMQKGKNLLNFKNNYNWSGSSKLETLENGYIFKGNINSNATTPYLASCGWVSFLSKKKLPYILGQPVTISLDITPLEKHDERWDTETKIYFSSSNGKSAQSNIYKLELGKKSHISCTLSPDRTNWVDATWQCWVYLCSHTMKIENVQIEYGDTETAYEPYVEPITHNVFLDESLRGIGDYMDYIDFSKNKATTVITKMVLNGSENIKKFLGTTTSPHPYNYISLGSSGMVRSDIGLCNQLTLQTNFSYSREGINTFRVYNSSDGGARFAFRMYKDGNPIVEVDEIKNLLAQKYAQGQPLIVYYALTSLKKEEINCILPKITEKTTVFEIDSDVQPSNMYGKYIK